MVADQLRIELARIQEQLLELPSDAFAERYELRVRQDELPLPDSITIAAKFDRQRNSLPK